MEETKKTQEDRGREDNVILLLEMDDHGAVFDSADAILIHDIETANILGANQKACEMFRYTHAEALNSAGSANLPPYIREDALRWVKKAAIEGPQLFEWRARDKSGRLFRVEVNLKLASIGGREFVLAVVRDTGKRKRVEQELHATKDYLKTVFNKIHDAIFVHDLTGKVVDVNENMLDLYRCSREEAIGLSIIPDYSSPDNP
ncbi:MAG: PAS domain-containing protein, partial [Syntrophorhabdales bacterium]